jgi:tetratricopeptide (TPR) repeat protein
LSPAPACATRRRVRAAVFVLAAVAAFEGRAQQSAPLLEGLDAYHAAAGTRSVRAQRHFDQGVVLAFGFNPAESARAFEAATREDAACALCWWGLAWSLGPSINIDMAEEAKPRVAAALARARKAAAKAPERSRLLVEALAKRHPPRGAIDEEAYEKAMAALARRFPRDADVALLAAEALMNLRPYDWWERDGRPRPWTGEIERRLQRALALAPRHPGALHYWIHLQESSPHPARAALEADRLRDLVPGSGHLLHMPSHIDMRTGRYAEASAANERSIEADRRYLEQVDAQGAYRVGYAAHNHHFLWASAAMQGRSRRSLEAAREAYQAACGPNAGDLSTGTLQHYAALPLYALVRFARWEEILRGTLPPDTREPYPLAVFHFARGSALARTGQPERARQELARLEAIAADPSIARAKVKNINTAARLADIARSTLAAEIARAEGDKARAVTLLRAAVATEDGLAYDEPHLWLAPTRQALGGALLEAGRPSEAERVFREDLARYPENGWSLHGLARALRDQGLAAEEVQARFRQAWREADFVLEP